ncbi:MULTISPECIES: hypothetical protein [unclassified Sphingomonas]|nr:MULTISPECIES: hypothetical protein [unclassified Sphingomonas]
MQGPIGYPPPTLVRKRSGFRKRAVMVLVAVVLMAGGYGVTWLIQSRQAPQPAERPVPPPMARAGTASADMPAAALPDAAAKPAVAVETPADGATVDEPVDARRPNRWYYVPRLGDGPGAIYSRTGGQWSYALACTTAAKTIEIIAVGTGSPGDFDRQAITVGKVRLMMDATYSPDGGGTIATTLPSSHAFFNALDGSVPMQIQLHANRKTVVPVGPEVVRLIRDCRGRG